MARNFNDVTIPCHTRNWNSRIFAGMYVRLIQIFPQFHLIGMYVVVISIGDRYSLISVAIRRTYWWQGRRIVRLSVLSYGDNNEHRINAIASGAQLTLD